MTVPAARRMLRRMGWLMWGLILPILLIVAGVVTLRRRKRGR
jgi:ATP/ADP translocase